MIREILIIRTDNGLGDKDPTFKNIELTEYSAKFPRMGMPELTATLKWPTPLDDEWTGREYVTLRGERFFIRHTPSGKKDNNDARYTHEIEFTSEFAEILGDTYFIDAVPSYAETYDKPCTNNTTFSFYGTISEFCDRLNCAFIKKEIADSVLKTKTSLTTSDTPMGDGYCVMLDPYGEGNVYDPNKTYNFEWEDKTLWEAVTEGFTVTEIPFERRGKRIIFGAVPKVLARKFEYGHDNELLSIYHKNANAKVINRITMLGSTENIPHYYPNETEYGHISISEKPGNKSLSADSVSIVNMTQLLSRLNADTVATLVKTEVSNGNGLPLTAILAGIGSEDEYELSTYSFGRDLKNFDPDSKLVHKYLHLEFDFTVETDGEYVCDRIEGRSWRQDTSTPSENADMPLTGFAPVHLWKIDSTGSKTSLDSQIGRYGLDGGMTFGKLSAGRYRAHISLRIVNKSGLNSQVPVASFYRISSINIVDKKDANKKSYKYGWDLGNGKIYNIGELGVKVNVPITDAMIGDGFGWTASGRMPFQTNLIPPKFRDTLGAERFYDALNDTYTDPDTDNPYVFPNPFVAGAPSEHIYRNEEIKPTIEGVTNAGGQLMGVIADVAYDADDNDILKPDATESNDKNDTLKYEHSFFYLKLNVFNGPYGFDLFAHASQTDPMTIQMTDGSCNGCKFKIQAVRFTDETGLETYKNPIVVQGGKPVGVVSEDGIRESDLDPNQQNTQTHSIWICVQKDAETFGVIMPNRENAFRPKVGDPFNIINIDLPQGYILAAEKRLEEEGIRYMADNNEEKFTFDIQASRIFFAENPDVLAQLDEYSKIKVRYNGREYEQYVNQLTIDCKDSEALPNIGIDLTDTLAVGQSFAERVAERASSLIANAYTMGGAFGGGSGSRGLTTRLADQRYVNKTEDDRSAGKIASDVGFEVGEFVSGANGGIFYRDPETGQTYIEVDKIKARMKAIFAELEVAKEQSIGGKFDITPGGGIDISYVEELTDSYRCYFKAKDEDKGADCRFVVGDQARCSESNISNGTTQNASNRYYWRLVTAVNNNDSYIELSKTDCDKGSDIPMAGDTVVQLGNRNNPERQSAIVLSTVDAYAPCVTLYNDIDHYSLDGKAVVEYGVDKTKNPPEPFFNCYGRFFFGPKGGDSYLKFEPSVGKLVFSGELINISSLNGKDIDKYIEDAVMPTVDKKIEGYDYIKEALADGATTTNGGLLLTSLIKLGQWDKTDKENPILTKVTAGINGLRNHDKTIASWWGGDMVDKYYNDSVVPRPNPLESGYAQALIRMDGSGYLAGGNIRWNELGNLILDNGISLGGGSTTIGNLVDTVESLTLLFNKFSQGIVPIVLDTNGNRKRATWGDIASDLSNLYAVESIKGFYTEEFISARGFNADGSAGGGATQLRMLEDVLIGNDLKSGQALVYNGAKWVNQTVSSGLDTTELGQYLTQNEYARLSDIPSLTGYATQSWAEGKFATKSDLSSHTGNTTVHITADERTKWNATSSNLDTILGSDTDNIINKWDEIVAFLDTYTEVDTLANLLSNKADKTTQVSAGTGLTGGGTLASDITLALATSGVTAGTYTKLTVDAYGRVTKGASLAASDIPTLAISKISGLQDTLNAKLAKAGDTMTGLLKLNAGAEIKSGQKLTIGDCEITWDADKGGLCFSKGIYSEEWVSARGANANASDVTGGLAWNEIKAELDKNGYATQSWVSGRGFLTSSALTGYATQDWVKNQNYLTSHQSLANYMKFVVNANYVNASFNDASLSQKAADTYIEFWDSPGWWNIRAGKFSVPNGTSAQFLKADGSVDATSYLASSVYTASDILTKLKTVDGSGSGLDADLLDGYHESVFFKTTRGSIPTAFIDITDYNKGAADYANYASGTYSIQRSGYSSVFVNFAHNSGGSTSALQLMTKYEDNASLKFRKTIDSNRVSGPWRTILTELNIGSFNAGSATKLQTARTLWGQSFDGTANVSGNMTSVGNITGSSAMTIQSTNGRLTLNAPTTALDLKFAGDDTKSVILNGTAFKPFDAATHKLTLGSSSAVWERIYGRYIDTDSGYDLRLCVAGTEKLHITAANGYVGVNNNSPVYQLDVNGKIRANNEIISSSANAFRMVYGNYGAFFRNDGANTYLLLTASGDQYGTWNTLRPFSVNNSTGLVSMSNGLSVNKITIGSCTITYENGGLHFSSGIYSDSFVSARGYNGNASDVTGVLAWSEIKAELDKNGYATQSWVSGRGFLTSSALTGYATQDWVKNQNYLTSHQSLANYMKFVVNANYVNASFNDASLSQKAADTYIEFWDSPGWWNIRAGKFSVPNGTSAQFLKADGSVDATSYLASSVYTASDILTKLKTVDGSGSGLDADLLDGYHESVFFKTTRGSIPTAFIDITDYNKGAADYANYASGTYSIQRSGYSSVFVNFAHNSGGSTSALQLMTKYEDNASLKFRKTIDSNRVSGPWRTILTELNIGSFNAGSATKLQTSRTIWGQSFDGSGNVDGTLHINAPAGSYVQGIRIHTSSDKWCTIALCGDDNTGASGTSAKTWSIFNKDGDFYINKNGSSTQQAPRMWGHSNGWTFGNTSTSSYALNTASFICDSWVRTKGATGWYNETYGGGWYMADSTWIRNHNNKPLYMNTATIRTDGQLQVGNNGEKFLVNKDGDCTLAGKITSSKATNTFLAGNQGNAIINSTADAGAYTMLAKLNSSNGYFTMGSYAQQFKLYYTVKSLVDEGKNEVTKSVMLLNEGGATTLNELTVGGEGFYVAAGGSSSFGTTFTLANSVLFRKNVVVAGVNFYFTSQSNGTGEGLWFTPEATYNNKKYFGLMKHTNRSWTADCCRFFFDGTFWAKTGIYSDGYVSARGQNTSSDAFLKNILRPIEIDVRKIATAPSVLFAWKSDHTKDVGSIAQFWKTIDPRLTPQSPEGFLTLQYGKAALLSVISVAKKVVSHEDEIKALKKEIERLSKRVKELEKA